MWLQSLKADRIREVMDLLPDTSWVLYNREMEILEVADRNRVLKDILKKSRLSEDLHQIADPPFHPEVKRVSEEAFTRGPTQTRLNSKSGLVKVSALPLGKECSHQMGLLMVQGNEGSLVEYRSGLEKEKEEARETSEVKSRFMARISHEIRTPLNAIIGFIEQLQKTSLDKTQKNYLNIVDKSAVYLLDLVNEILTFSKLESGKQQLDKVDFNLKDMFGEVYSTMKNRAAEKKINLRFSFDKQMSQVVRGDAFRLKQVLINLISNAIKFTAYGYVEIKVNKLRDEGDRIWTEIIVADTGIGIPEEKIRDIFKEYRQASIGIARKHGGTGLGLTICKRLTELMHGSISVQSTEGKGSRFLVTIPLERSNLTYLTKNTLRINNKVLAQRRAMIVDDDAMNRMLGRIILEGFNMEVSLASDGREAMELAGKSAFDVILLDIHMPEISGLDVARYIRNDLNNQSVKILAVTADMIRKELEKYKKEGIDDYMIKPYREINMFNKLCQVLDVNPELIRYETVKIVLKEDPGDALYDLTELRSVTRDQASFFNEMLETFMENAAGGTARMQKAFEQGDYALVMETAHRLIPSYKHLAITKVVSDLVELKNICARESDSERMNMLVSRIASDSVRIIGELKKEFM
ncbi:MAG: ATP-binding protein [Bacteroidales bacterium]|nr:ATP-binding protein [Bacteroidales bacterium]